MFLNAYIPWDITRLEGVKDELFRSIGVAVTVSVPIFGIICGIFIIVMIIRYFTGKMR